jgi:cytochrome P450/NADPH-cytochrome P450 reductase
MLLGKRQLGGRDGLAADRRLDRQPGPPAVNHPFAVPQGMAYNAGDHLGIIPRNDLDQIRRVLRRFKLDPGLYLTVTPRTSAGTHLPVNEPVPLLGVLANCVEL